jgi:hypothetical protein
MAHEKRQLLGIVGRRYEAKRARLAAEAAEQETRSQQAAAEDHKMQQVQGEQTQEAPMQSKGANSEQELWPLPSGWEVS